MMDASRASRILVSDSRGGVAQPLTDVGVAGLVRATVPSLDLSGPARSRAAARNHAPPSGETRPPGGPRATSVFLRVNPSAPRYLALTAPAASSAAGSRPRAPSGSAHPNRSRQCTSPSTDRRSTSHSVPLARIRRRAPGLRLPQLADHLQLFGPALPNCFAPLFGSPPCPDERSDLSVEILQLKGRIWPD